MEKVKVWGLEIDSCWKCYHHGRTDFDELCCSYTGTIIKSDINEDCPFSKPITKEVIEGFGFKLSNILEADSDEIIEGFEKYINENDRIILHFSAKYGIVIYKSHCYNSTSGNWEQIDLFKGTINNPIELEFILKSVGVIE